MAGYLRGGSGNQLFRTTQNLQRFSFGPRATTLAQVDAAGYATLPIAESDVVGLVADLALKAPLASPTFTGDPKAPTPATADNDTSIATTAFVKAQGYLTSSGAAGAYQPLDGTLTAVAGLNATVGLVEQTGADAFTKRAMGVAAGTSVLTRADGDARYATGPGVPTPGISGGVPYYNSTTTLASSAVLTAARLTMGGGAGAAPADSSVQVATHIISSGFGATTESCGLELGGQRTGNGISYIDLHAASGTDYEARLYRNAGVNGTFDIANAGTGRINLSASGGVVCSSNVTVGGNANPTLGLSTNYTVLWAPDGIGASGAGIFVGSNVDPTNYYDNTAHTFANRAGAVSFATINSSGMTVSGDLTTGSAAGTGSAVIEVGGGRSGSGTAVIDMHGATGTDYEVRVLRASGANGAFSITNTGSGDFSLYNGVGFKLNNGTTDVMTVGAGGNVMFAGNYLYQNGSTGAVSSTGGPLIYADLNNTAFKLGSGNNSFLFQSYAGTNLASLSGIGNLVATGILGGIGRYVRPGQTGPSRLNTFNIDWAPGAQLWVDTSNLGTIAFTSDYRIKENVEPLESTWDQVKALRPISYTVKDWGLFRRDPAERWGFIAHELQDTLTESAASGHKDQDNLVQSIDLPAVLAATTRALQEAMARIEALEARLAA